MSNVFEDKNVTEWVELNDNLYNNHFINNNPQCYIKVDFNRKSENNTYKLRIPVYPSDISFGNQTNYTSGEILGRSGQIAGYVSTGDTTTRISLHLHRELQQLDTGISIRDEVKYQDRNKIDNLISLIQAANYPQRFPNGIAAPIVTYVFGKTKIIGKQTSFSTKWDGVKIGNMYMECFIEVQITHVPEGINYFDDMLNKLPYVFD